MTLRRVIDFSGTLRIEEMCELFDCHHTTIRRRLHEGTFPIPPLPDVDNKYRWSGPFVKRWLEENGDPLEVTRAENE